MINFVLNILILNIFNEYIHPLFFYNIILIKLNRLIKELHKLSEYFIQINHFLHNKK